MRRIPGRAIGVLGALAFAASGCGTGDPARRVTAADIVPLPPGTAVGSLYAGDYVSTTGRIEACRCRSGGCATLRFLPGVAMSFAQTDGTLVMTSATSPVAFTGAVDGDGSFRINGSIADASVTEYLLMDGQFVVSNGALTGMTFTQEVSVMNYPYDCDLRLSGRTRFLGPSAVALGPGNRRREAAWSAGLLGVVAP
jgi:hypothetical protein